MYLKDIRVSQVMNLNLLVLSCLDNFRYFHLNIFFPYLVPTFKRTFHFHLFAAILLDYHMHPSYVRGLYVH